jgi:hypothetical protein
VSNKVEATFHGSDQRPCQGKNSNICVAEGCYGESCLTRCTWTDSDKNQCLYLSGQDHNHETIRDAIENSNRISGQDSKSNDFPVKKSERFSGQFFDDLAKGLEYFLLVLLVLLLSVGGVLMAGVLAYGFWMLITHQTFWTLVVTGVTLTTYIACVVYARRSRNE